MMMFNLSPAAEAREVPELRLQTQEENPIISAVLPPDEDEDDDHVVMTVLNTPPALRRRHQAISSQPRRAKKSSSSRVCRKATVYAQDENAAPNIPVSKPSPDKGNVAVVPLQDADPMYDDALEQADQAGQLDKARSLHERLCAARSSLAALDPFFNSPLASPLTSPLKETEYDCYALDCYGIALDDMDEATNLGGVCDANGLCNLQ